MIDSSNNTIQRLSNKIKEMLQNHNQNENAHYDLISSKADLVHSHGQIDKDGKVNSDITSSVNKILVTDSENRVKTTSQLSSSKISDSATYPNIGLNASASQSEINNAIDSTVSTLATKDEIDNIIAGDINLTGYVKETDVKNNLTSVDTNKPLSAVQGKILNENKISKTNGNTNILLADGTNIAQSTFLTQHQSITLEKQSPADNGFSATYMLKQNNQQVGDKINIPKDLLLQSAELKTVGSTPTTEETSINLSTGDKYILFIVNTEDEDNAKRLLLPVTDLIPSATATTSTNGLMSSTDKTKLDGIATSANNYSHPNSGVTAGTNYNGNQTPTFGGTFNIPKLTFNAGGHITTSANSTVTIPSTAATTSASGLMSSTDKTKLDGIATSANNYSHPSGTAKTGNPTANQTPGFGGSFTVTQFTSNAGGHISGATDRTITIPSTIATTSTNGLMSSTDKTKLDGIATGANNYSHPSGTAKTGNPTANQTPGFGGSFTVTQFTSNSSGHISGATDRTITIPSSTVTSSANGLAISTDKAKLDKSMTVGFGTVGGTTSAYTVSITGVTLTHGTLIALYNGIGANAASATLNVNNLGAKPIYYNASAITASRYPNKSTCLFIYNTSIVSTGCWQLIYSYDSNTTYSTATTSANGLMSSTDKTKLDGIATSANNYSHPSGTAKTGNPTANQTPGFGGSFTVTQFTSNATGHISGATDRTITIPSATATTSAAGLMSKDDKSKLNDIATGATKITVDSTLSATSTNPVQNKVINQRIENFESQYIHDNGYYIRLIRTDSSGNLYSNQTDLLDFEGTRLQVNVGDKLNIVVRRGGGAKVSGAYVRIVLGTTVKEGYTNSNGRLNVGDSLSLNNGVNGMAYAILKGTSEYNKAIDIAFIEYST